MARKHNVDEVLKALRKKNDCRVRDNEILVLSNKIITNSGDIVENPNKHNDLGNGSWGKIDFLVRHCGYFIFKVEKFKNN